MSETQIAIRRAEVKDASELASLFAMDAMLHFTDVPPHSGVTYWEKRLAEYADAAHLPLLAVADNAVVGVLLLRGIPQRVRRKHVAVVTLLAVHPSHRKRGIGRVLVSACAQVCDDWLNLRRIETTIVDSAPLVKFFSSLGFVSEGVLTKSIMQHGRAVDTRFLARVNSNNMRAAEAPPLATPKRRRVSKPIKFAIRTATVDDADALTEIFSSRSAALGTLQHPYQSSATRRDWLANAKSNRECILVATVNGRIVGHASVHPMSDNPREAHVCGVGIAIHESHQGSGIGRALMDACLDFADRWANYSRVLLSVYADNKRAIALYESLGFVVEARCRDFAFRDGGYVESIFMGRLTKALTESA
jgi:L-phenylalanine/L-methionine N-acetyltransferase